MVGRESDRQQEKTTPARRPVEQGGTLERVPVEQVGKVADGAVRSTRRPS
jgi:hypothetical protein